MAPQKLNLKFASLAILAAIPVVRALKVGTTTTSSTPTLLNAASMTGTPTWVLAERGVPAHLVVETLSTALPSATLEERHVPYAMALVSTLRPSEAAGKAVVTEAPQAAISIEERRIPAHLVISTPLPSATLEERRIPAHLVIDTLSTPLPSSPTLRDPAMMTWTPSRVLGERGIPAHLVLLTLSASLPSAAAAAVVTPAPQQVVSIEERHIPLAMALVSTLRTSVTAAEAVVTPAPQQVVSIHERQIAPAFPFGFFLVSAMEAAAKSSKHAKATTARNSMWSTQPPSHLQTPGSHGQRSSAAAMQTNSKTRGIWLAIAAVVALAIVGAIFGAL